MKKQKEIAVFGGGCLWCGEAVFKRLRGVENVISGYAGGTAKNPTYEQVCSGKTGHAEVIKVEYDPDVISYEQLLSVFFSTHDPTQVNRQGPDVGDQYRSSLFYITKEQEHITQLFIQQLEEEGVYKGAIVTEIKPLTNFYEAEVYPREYYDRNRDMPYCQMVIDPKIQKLQQKYAHLLK